MRAERKCSRGGGCGGLWWGVTEILKDEREGGSEITSHYKSREKGAQRRSEFGSER